MISGGNNLDTEMLLAISPRKPMKSIRKLTNPKSFAIVNNKQVYVDGTNFYYDGVSKGHSNSGT